MRYPKTTLFLLLLMCFSSVSGFFSVICHGSDGHVTVESVAHGHCQCPDTDDHGQENQGERSFDLMTVRPATDHDHCKDTLATSDFVIPERKSSQSTSQKNVAANLLESLSLTQTTSESGCLASINIDLSAFYTPLSTIILLA